jgi:hypothetical protein
MYHIDQHVSNDRKSIYVKKGVLVLITSLDIKVVIATSNHIV